MIPNIAPEVVSTIVFAVVYRPDGASLSDIAGAFTAPSDVPKVEGWVATLVAAGVLDSVTDGATTRYFATPAASSYLTALAPSGPAPSAAAPAALPDAQPPPAAPSTPPSASPSGPPSALPSGASSTSTSAQPIPPSVAPSQGAEPVALPGLPPSPPAPSAPPSTPPSAAHFEALFDGVVVDIVARIMPRISAANYLSVRARRELDAAEIPAFVQYGRDRLSRLTLGDCLRLGLDPAQYEVWRQQYFGVAAAPSTPPPSPPPSTPPSAGANVPPSAPSIPPSRSHAARTDDVPDVASASNAAAPAVAVHPAGQEAADAAADNLVAGLLKPFLDALLRPSAPPPVSTVPSVSGGVSGAENVSGAIRGSVKSLLRACTDAVRGRDRRRLAVAARALLIVALVVGVYAAAVRVYVFVRQSPWLAVGAALGGAVVLVLVDRFWQGRKAAKAAAGSAAIPAQAPTVAPAVQGAVRAAEAGVSTPSDPAVQDTVLGPSKGASPRRFWLLTWGLIGISAVAVAAVVVATRVYVKTGSQPPAPATAGAMAGRSAEQMAGQTAATKAGATAAAVATSGAAGSASGAPVQAHGSEGGNEPGRQSPVPAAAGGKAGAVAIESVRGTRSEGETEGGTGRQNGGPRDGKSARTAGGTAAAGVAAVPSLNLTPHSSTSAAPAESAAPAAALRAGTLLVGVVVDAAAGDSQRVAFEITAAPAGTQRVAAVLRSDGAWSDARSYQGEWTADADGCVLTLRTRGEDRVDGAGSLLADHGARTVVLRLREDGSVTSTPAGWQLRRVDPAAAATVRAEFTRGLVPLLAATQPGRVYRGTATSRLRKTAEPLVLRFTEQDAEGALLRATLESATNPAWVRPFRGTLVGNTYRAAGSPLRLRSDDNDRVGAADPRTVLGLSTYNDSLVLPLHLEGARLVGQDERFGYEFAPADAGASGRAARSESESGRAARSESESGRAARSDSESESESGGRSGRGSAGANAGRAAVGVRPGVSNQGAGSALAGQGGGRTARQDTATATTAAGAGSLNSAPSSNLTLNSSNSAGAAAPGGAAAAAAELPAFPATPGAYALVDGRWVRLPRNNGRAIQSLPQMLAAKLRDASRYQDALAKRKPEEVEEAVADLDFDGTGDVPTARPESVVIACVGVTLPTAAQVKDYPQLKTYPAIELAALMPWTDGSRTASLYPVTPGIVGFGKDRVAAKVEVRREGGRDVAILRCEGRVPAGRYALWGGPEPCELAVAVRMARP